MRIKIILIAAAAVFIGIKIYNKYVEKKSFETTMKEIVTEREKFRNKEKIETYSYLSNDEIAIAGQKFVEKNLKAPSTAQFPPLFKSSVKKIKSGHYSVSSYVDSQNEFGAMIRSNYIVELKQTTDGKISLINIDIFK